MILKDRFVSLAGKFTSENDKILSAWNELEANYSAPGRHYHTLSHLEKMFAEIDQAKSAMSDYDSVAWAVFYHDFIYDSTRQDNEERSALAALKTLNNLKVPIMKIMKIQSLILATKSHESEEGDDADTAIFLDADLAVLGADEKTYSGYAENVRKEYSVYPDEIYRQGRKKVLEHFLENQRIFKSEDFHKRLEKKAKENLARELQSLS
jgi:predicted metal-dependent HD superfamily phosphohydrolase